jgi:MFS family permease
MTKDKRNAVIAWIFFGLILVTNLAAIVYYLTRPVGQRVGLAQSIFPLVPVLFALVGALITSRQPRNVIGLVMMLPGLSFAFFLEVVAPYTSGNYLPPAAHSIWFLIILWFSNWNWLLLVLPIMFIMLLFPTGRLLSPRWKWVVYLGLWIVAVLLLLITFSQELGPNQEPIPWSVPNPIGFISSDWFDSISGPYLILFPIWILLCAASLFLRFRRSRGVEREQIKWLFYAGVVFILFYLPSFMGNTYYQAENLLNLLLPVGMSTLPIAIGIAILRYRLYDIDVIIQKTLQYALLTGLLVLVYFGSVILLQSLTENLFGEQSPLVIVLSTLAIAALFNPLRTRIQDFIDLRFYRKKYDAEQALAQFAATARDEVDMDQLNAALLQVVEQTVQPESVSLWLHQRKRS